MKAKGSVSYDYYLQGSPRHQSGSLDTVSLHLPIISYYLHTSFTHNGGKGQPYQTP